MTGMAVSLKTNFMLLMHRNWKSEAQLNGTKVEKIYILIAIKEYLPLSLLKSQNLILCESF